jgi:aminopeptidase N
MKDFAPQAVFLADYRPYPFLVDEVRLRFRLAPRATRVVSRIVFRPKPEAPSQVGLALDAAEFTPIWAAVNGERLPEELLTSGGAQIVIPRDRLGDGPFVWEAEVELDPAANTRLEGLYLSNGMFCTQCEAEGFRRITYYPDRPDVTAPFHVRIESDLPVKLSNGNLVGNGAGWAEWHDPHPKPAYLFALVAGDLVATSSVFTRASGRPVDLNIWVRPGPDTERTSYALDALERAMRWDEEVYGLEYDLDVFNIVAVDDFNMGAMENKGLNIFNSRYVLVRPETATDRDFELVEGIVAHEYFHNWTGNRVTCRDWFQLALKEGLTVFREQQFSGDMRSRSVRRIEEVVMLRARQFREDNGPLAHPVRPESYIEINNFYTATVYEKGAELIGILARLVGRQAFVEAVRLYLARHDGRAATIEDWLEAFEDATGRDLSQFRLWYTQSGTPRLIVRDEWQYGTYYLHLRQETPPTPGQPHKLPLFIPVAVGLLYPDGTEALETTMIELTRSEQTFTFRGLRERPIASVLRDFSAPVLLRRDSSTTERAFRFTYDTDPYARWDAGRMFGKNVLIDMIVNDEQPGPEYPEAVRAVLVDDGLDPSYRALMLRLPSEDDIAQALFDSGVTPEPTRIYTLRRHLNRSLGMKLRPELIDVFDRMEVQGPYTPDADAAGRRALRLETLALLSWADEGARAAALFRTAGNMTEQFGAITTLMGIGGGEEELRDFYEQWRHDRLVIDKWFSMQARHAPPHMAVQTVERLTRHPDFDVANLNRFRSLFGAFAANSAGFHNPTGQGYDLMAEWLLRVDAFNPQTAARMLTAFETWRRYDSRRQTQMTAALRRFLTRDGISRDTYEMVTRMLGG